jgi:hypothetical protein
LDKDDEEKKMSGKENIAFKELEGFGYIFWKAEKGHG